MLSALKQLYLFHTFTDILSKIKGACWILVMSKTESKIWDGVKTKNPVGNKVTLGILDFFLL